MGSVLGEACASVCVRGRGEGQTSSRIPGNDDNTFIYSGKGHSSKEEMTYRLHFLILHMGISETLSCRVWADKGKQGMTSTFIECSPSPHMRCLRFSIEKCPTGLEITSLQMKPSLMVKKIEF